MNSDAATHLNSDTATTAACCVQHAWQGRAVADVHLQPTRRVCVHVGVVRCREPEPALRGQHTSLSDQGNHFAYTLHGVDYLKVRESRSAVFTIPAAGSPPRTADAGADWYTLNTLIYMTAHGQTGNIRYIYIRLRRSDTIFSACRVLLRRQW